LQSPVVTGVEILWQNPDTASRTSRSDVHLQAFARCRPVEDAGGSVFYWSMRWTAFR
jgi:hypothetical protein